MKFIKQLERLQRLDHIIRNELTGTPEEFSKKLGVSRSHLYRLIETLKDYGAEIEYSRKQQFFHYKNPFIFKVFILNNILSTTEMKKISGGFSKKIIPSLFMRPNNFILANSFAQNETYSYECL